MTEQDPKFIFFISVSKAVAGRVKQLLSHRDDVVIKTGSVSSLSSRSSGPLKTTPPHLLLCECKEGDVESLIQHTGEIRSRFPQIKIVVISSAPHHADAVRLMKSGVDEYLAYPDDQSVLFELIDAAIEDWVSKQTRKAFQSERKKSFDFQNIVGNSPQLHNMIERSRKLLNNTNITVLIQGETGTGKELMAKAIHYNSQNASHPFVEISCSSIPETLLESELFGHEKGAFTDAKNQKIGLFELAGNGTIFLDEIGDITSITQSKLLNVLEEKKIRRLGGIVDIPVHARIITATSKDLLSMVKHGTMRKDLYYRLAVFSLDIPPLRNRTGDILLLAEHFLQEFAKDNEKEIDGFTPRALEKLTSERWEGNVRELKHTIERAVLLTNNSRLDEEDLEILSTSRQDESADTTVTQSDSGITISLPLEQATLVQVEKEFVRAVLASAGGNKKKASEILNISRPRLDRIIQEDPAFFRSVIS